MLKPSVEGEDALTGGYSYPEALYLVGMCNEGLGNTAEAIANFAEMLSYWGEPELELKEIKDARQRLARLRKQS